MAKIYFEYKDLVSFGNYLMKIIGNTKQVTREDLENWEEEEKVLQIKDVDNSNR